MSLWSAAGWAGCTPGVSFCFDKPLGPVLFIVGIVVVGIIYMAVMSRKSRR